ncbi:hypothetical protein CBS9595_000735 [Malassezia furfur]|nr:hypothetical protein CBS9595_000735 [Malassezia furfur]
MSWSASGPSSVDDVRHGDTAPAPVQASIVPVPVTPVPAPVTAPLGAAPVTPIVSDRAAPPVAVVPPPAVHIDVPVAPSVAPPTGDVMHTDPTAPLAAVSKPVPRGTGLVYDVRMMLHTTPAPGETHPEQPARIERIYTLLEQNGCVARMVRIPAREALRSEVALVHEPSLWDEFEATVQMPFDELVEYSRQLEARASLYLNEYSTISARFSCGSVIEMCQAVATRRVRNGFALVRPPGHHAEPNCGTGFCLYNNVAVAATSVLANSPPHDPVNRILIVDWDVHHGNGTQRAFWDNPNVLYVSLHRYENGTYYPGTTYGNYDRVGGPAALGKSLNIPWPCGGMGDADYLHAFQRCILPVAYEFAPDMVIISAGFDAAEGDMLGGCHVSPAGYAHLTHHLAALANGRLVVALEGGYNLDAIANSALAVTRVLLDEPLPVLPAGLATSTAGADAVARTVRAQAPYWRSLAVEQAYMPPSGPSRSAGDVLAAQRSAALWSAHRMVPLPPIPAENIVANQVTCSATLMTQGLETLLVFVHDNGAVQLDDAILPGEYAHQPALYMSDSSEFVAQWTSERGFACADMNTRASLPVRTLRNHDHDRALPRTNEAELKSQLGAQLLYLWDNFFALSPAKHIVLVAHGTACDAVVHLVSRRVVQDRVVAMIQLMGYNPIPLVPKQRQELKAWYYKNSLVVCPHDHPLYAWDEQSASGKRLGHTVRASEPHAANLVQAAWPEVEAFIDTKLKARRLVHV